MPQRVEPAGAAVFERIVDRRASIDHVDATEAEQAEQAEQARQFSEQARQVIETGPSRNAGV